MQNFRSLQCYKETIRIYVCTYINWWLTYNSIVLRWAVPLIRLQENRYNFKVKVAIALTFVASKMYNEYTTVLILRQDVCFNSSINTTESEIHNETSILVCQQLSYHYTVPWESSGDIYVRTWLLITDKHHHKYNQA